MLIYFKFLGAETTFWEKCGLLILKKKKSHSLIEKLYFVPFLLFQSHTLFLTSACVGDKCPLTDSDSAALELGSVLCGVSANRYLQLQFNFRFVPSLLLG